MESLLKLKVNCEKQLSLNHLDNDVKVNMTTSDILYWCKDFIRIHENIEETSISNSHKIERKQKLINQILNL